MEYIIQVLSLLAAAYPIFHQYISEARVVYHFRQKRPARELEYQKYGYDFYRDMLTVTTLLIWNQGGQPTSKYSKSTPHIYCSSDVKLIAIEHISTLDDEFIGLEPIEIEKNTATLLFDKLDYSHGLILNIYYIENSNRPKRERTIDNVELKINFCNKKTVVTNTTNIVKQKNLKFVNIASKLSFILALVSILGGIILSSLPGDFKIWILIFFILYLLGFIAMLAFPFHMLFTKKFIPKHLIDYLSKI